ncbi:hypothetical protein ABK040_007670 [Willaertia magna]
MSMPTQIPPEAQILQYMTGYYQLKAGPKSCHTLAKELQLQENELFRLLRAATALGLLSFNTDKQTYELTELSTILTEDHPRSLKSFSLMFGEESYFAWEIL